VLAEGSQRVLEHPERVRALLDDARALGATDLFVQVYRGGRAWFDSSHADASPHRAAAQKAGEDPLASLVRQAHAAGLSVHAWVNALSLAQNRDAPIVRKVGKDAVAVDRQGRSLLDYPEYEVPPPERRPDRAARDALSVDGHHGHRLDAECSRVSAQDREVPGATASEAEISAHEQPARPQGADEHVVDELLRGERGEAGIEACDVRPRDAKLAEQLELSTQRGQSRGRDLAGEKLARMRLEGENRRRQPEILGGFDQPTEHRLMAAVDTVEVADGECDVICAAGRRSGDSAIDLHAGISPRAMAGRR
jgi:hypothetical protein